MDAKGNNWADTMAKFGAAEHEIEKAKVKEAKLLKAKARKVARWIGMAAVASFRLSEWASCRAGSRRRTDRPARRRGVAR